MTESNADWLKHGKRLHWLSNLKSVNRQLRHGWIQTLLVPSDLPISGLCFLILALFSGSFSLW